MESISDDLNPLSGEWDDILGVLVDDQDGMSMGDFQPHKKQCTRKRKSNPDADDIARATEEALGKLGLDPNSEEAKLAKRKIRNRISAQSHRDRKNQQLSLLEDEINRKNRHIEDLNREVMLLRLENEQLRQQLSLPVVSRIPTTVETDSDGFVSSGTFTPTGYVSLSSGSHSPEHASIPLPAFASNRLVGGTIMKSISFLCVACVICLCGWSQVDMQMNSSIAASGRRLISVDLTPSELFPFAQNSTINIPYPSISQELQGQNIIMNKPTTVSPRNLRRRSSSAAASNHSFPSTLNFSLSAPIMRSLAASSSLGASYLSRDLIPFPVTKSPTEDWSSYQQRINALSSSQIFLQSGFALFDPAFHAVDIKRRVPSQWASKPATAKLASPVPVRALLPPVQVSISPLKDMDVEKDKNEQNAKNWPAIRQEHVVARLPSRPIRQQPYVEEIFTEEIVKEALHTQAADLIAQSNIVTVTLPASAIKHGRSLQESEAGTVDSILRMFNLTENTTVGESAHGLKVADAWLEMSCIVVGAKVMWNQHQHA